MATLREYFEKDGRHFTLHKDWSFTFDNRETFEIRARLHYAFTEGAKYISFYIPRTVAMALPEVLALQRAGEVANWTATEASVSLGLTGYDEVLRSDELIFTGIIYLYSERSVPEEHKRRLIEEGAKAGHHLIFRGPDYMEARNKAERPRAFISHDSRDKEQIAEPLASALQRALCPVWYDEYSLKVGDSLRESIEAGLRQSSKCILVLTPNFMANGGWSKREYDSIFTRELVDREKVILPIWYNVTVRDVYDYSPILADRVGLHWEEGQDEVVRKLLHVLA